MGDPTPLHYLPLSEAARRLQRRELTPLQLLEAVLSRLQATEPHVHAYARVTEDQARRQAELAGREIAAGHYRGPLHGIPVAVKDLYLTAGIPTEAGSQVLKDFVPGRDATLVRRLRDAGALLTGKTVTHEFAYGQDEPPTRNAWSHDGYPGGSSAGSGVAVAAGSAFAALGTDTGGSVRLPASLNGVVGLKPTFGRLSKAGVVPMSPTLDHPGILARTVRDAALVLGTVAGVDPDDPSTLDEPVPDYGRALREDLAGVRLGIERRHYFYPGVQPEVRERVEAAFDQLTELGAELVEVELPEFEQAIAAGLTLVLVDTSAHHQQQLRSRGAAYHPGTRHMLQLGELISATDYLRAWQARRLLRRAVAGVFLEHRLDALAGPTLPLPTVPLSRLSAQLDTEAGQTALGAYVHHCIPFNLTGQPALTVPCGFTTTGLPVGLQFAGRPFGEGTVLRIGHAYEQATPWHRRRPPL